MGKKRKGVWLLYSYIRTRKKGSGMDRFEKFAYPDCFSLYDRSFLVLEFARCKSVITLASGRQLRRARSYIHLNN